MTTTDNFPLIPKPESSGYLLQNSAQVGNEDDDQVLNGLLIRGHHNKPFHCSFDSKEKELDLFDTRFCVNGREEDDFFCQVPTQEQMGDLCDVPSNKLRFSKKRPSRHLSGGGLLINLSLDNSLKTELFQLSGVGLPNDNFDNFLDLESIEVRQFLNQISPQSRVNSDATPQNRVNKQTPQSTNPFITTNPFNISNLSSPNKNPFLINDSSPAPHFTNPPKSSFILAVPVFPIFQQEITNSSTQTTEVGKLKEETNQLKKFMKSQNHSERDIRCLKETVKVLRTSGWYLENVSWQESVSLLGETKSGTFFIRDSSDPNFLFSLSVQTCRGPTSVRIHYVNGHFRLDAEEKLIPHMPSFNSVPELIDYYVENTKSGGKRRLKKDQVWIDSQGNVYSSILLVKPLHRKDYFSTLQHLARLSINRIIKKRLNAKARVGFRVDETSSLQSGSFRSDFDEFGSVFVVNSLPLPSQLLEYLKEYPFCN